MAFAIVFTFPLVFTTGRDSLIGLVPALQRVQKRRPAQAHVAITSCLVAAISGVACIVEDVSLVTGLLGATIGACLCWIFPASIYLKVVFSNPAPELEDAQRPLLSRKASAPRATLPTGGGALIVYSVAMVVVGTLSMFVGVSKALGVL